MLLERFLSELVSLGIIEHAMLGNVGSNGVLRRGPSDKEPQKKFTKKED